MKKVINYIIIIVSIVMVCLGLFLDISYKFGMTVEGKILFYVMPMLLLFINMVIQIKNTVEDTQKEIIKRRMLGLIFIIYIILLFTLLFLSSEYRHIDQNVPLEFNENKINIIPFKEISRFLSSGHLRNILVNVVGNLIAFSPMGFFIPMLFSNKIKNLKQFTLLMILIVLILELAQFVVNVGAADIDDVILNTLGAVIVYALMKTKIIGNMLKRIF